MKDSFKTRIFRTILSNHSISPGRAAQEGSRASKGKQGQVLTGEASGVFGSPCVSSKSKAHGETPIQHECLELRRGCWHQTNQSGDRCQDFGTQSSHGVHGKARRKILQESKFAQKVRGMEWRPVLVAAHVTFALWVFTRSRNARRFCNKVVQHQAFWEVWSLPYCTWHP